MEKDELKEAYDSIDKVLKKIKEAEGHKFKDFDVNHRLLNNINKGRLGNIIEEGLFGYKINSNKSADFDYLGLELKTAGVIKTKKGYRAKERLTLCTLNYFDVAKETFYESEVWQKNNGLLIVLYNYVENCDYANMKILGGFIHRFSGEDIAILENDYNLIAQKIKNGKAETISEGDTMYLGACHAGKGELVEQPFSKLKAPLRKFCLKNSYFTQIIREHLNHDKLENILNLNRLSNFSFEQAIEEVIKPYIGKSEDELKEIFGLFSDSKSRYERYTAAMLGIKGRINDTDEFKKAGIEVKTVRVEENGNIKESMSFPAFNFCKIIDQKWETSDLRNKLLESKFMFSIFRKRNGKLYFCGVKFWHMPEHIIENDAKKVFERTIEVLKSGNIIFQVKKLNNGKLIKYNNFPGIAYNEYVHVRPHGRDSNDETILPIPDRLTGMIMYTKQCFWISNKCIKKAISDEF